MADVLIVHDNQHLRDDYTAALADAGFSVLSTGLPLQALDVMDVNRPAALVTRVDFGQGRVSGDALARMARYRHPDLPVILISQPKWTEIISDVATSVLPHTVTPDELVKALKAALAASPAARREGTTLGGEL